ncbi:MAG: radical SAM protein [Bryobacterales bacterium]|nr:radical SAM protein [Bryobacterales bacterium]
MNILLYNPDNQVTKNYMPHLWMFVLQAVTPPGHKVFLIDGNAQSMTEESIAEFVRENRIELAGIGAMTRMAARAYRMADAIRAAGAKVVMGGPHVTEVPYEPIGLDGEPRHADAVALGEADYLWPRIVRDAEAGNLQEVYKPVDESGVEVKPSLEDYPVIPWETMDLTQFDLVAKVPAWARYLLEKAGSTWKSLYVVPIESGRGCPYGCDFCTVTGFFGDSIRFRSNESVVDEILRLKARAAREGGKVGVFFIDDNFAINKKRTKSLLRAMIENGAQVPWVAQISMNLLKDEELCDLIKESGGRWIFMGLESIDAASLKDVNKGFNKPDLYKDVLERLARRGIYSITSFIFGMDGDRPGVAQKTLDAIAEWPPGLPVYGLMTPYPATPLYDRLFEQGRLTRPKHWLDFRPFRMAYTPENISIDQAEAEVDQAWTESYSPESTARALRQIEGRPFHERAVMFFTRLAFRGIYFPQMTKRHWITLLWKNRESFAKILFEAYQLHRRHRRGDSDPPARERVARRKPEKVAA